MLHHLFNMRCLSPPAVHLPVPHLAGCRHQGNFGPDSRESNTQHHGQHLHLCLCSSWNFSHHQWPCPGGHPQRQHGPAEETGGRGVLHSGCTAACQGQQANAWCLIETSRWVWGRSRLTKPPLGLRCGADPSPEHAQSFKAAGGHKRQPQKCWVTAHELVWGQCLPADQV